ncbi:EamA family transporter [Pseudonocardia nantongensis]|uniref:EamA family transporter n=1 Tax=Pseudonocardia nantongensis TaxID=1181885 RepID=UPI00397BA7D8
MPELLALAAALAFGLVHFLSGLLARRADSYGVAATGQIGGTVLVAVVALAGTPFDGQLPLAAAPHVSAVALGWGALSGVGTGIGVAYLYRGLATGQISVVVPLSDVAAVALPVLFGVALLGDRPGLAAWLGIALAAPALWLVSRHPATGGSTPGAPGAGRTASGTRYGLLAGVGFAVQFLAISRIDPAAGLWPILLARLAAAVTIWPMARAAGADLRIPRRLVAPAALVGALGSVAIVLYLAATRAQLLAVATVLAALYPAVPVLLAIAVLGERPTRAQVAGLLTTATAIGLIALT